MKRFLGIWMVCILLAGMGTAALAESAPTAVPTEEPMVISEEFLLYPFQSDLDLKVKADDENDVFISFRSIKPFMFDPGLSENYYCFFEPDILVLREGKDTPAFRIWTAFYAKEWAFLDEIQITIDGATYAFLETEHTREETEKGDISESLLLCFDSKSFYVMDALKQHKSEEIKVKLVGNAYDVDFVMSPKMKENILHLYDLFVSAGGAEPEMQQGFTGSQLTLLAPEDGADPDQAQGDPFQDLLEKLKESTPGK